VAIPKNPSAPGDKRFFPSKAKKTKTRCRAVDSWCAASTPGVARPKAARALPAFAHVGLRACQRRTRRIHPCGKQRVAFRTMRVGWRTHGERGEWVAAAPACSL
jgi:hypothetical protein